MKRFISNPVDWNELDRAIFLGWLALLVPSLIFIAFSLIKYSTAESYLELRDRVEPFYLELLLNFSIGLFAFLLLLNLSAMWMRLKRDRWRFYSYSVAFSVAFAVIFYGYVSGDLITDGVLVLLVTYAVAMMLFPMPVLTTLFVFGIVATVTIVVSEFMGWIPYAPMFKQLPYGAEGHLLAWRFPRFILNVFVLFLSFYLTRIMVVRWRERENLYREMSNIDGLTRLSNRRRFMRRGEREVELARAALDPIACIMVDLDFFKSVNDTHGHHVGDAVLIDVAAVLEKNARETDEVARYGGEEFSILLPGTSMKVAEQVAERMRAAVEAHVVEVEDLKIGVTCSLGVSYLDRMSQVQHHLSDLLREADVALYEAKEAGKNRVVTRACAQG